MCTPHRSSLLSARLLLETHWAHWEAGLPGTGHAPPGAEPGRRPPDADRPVTAVHRHVQAGRGRDGPRTRPRFAPRSHAAPRSLEEPLGGARRAALSV